jgi:hypothetical protein
MGRSDKSLVYFALLSDNPFRAVGTGASLDILALRRQADNFAKRAKIGLAFEPALVDVFGPVDAEGLPSFVRSLQADTKLRTSYRILWPLSEGTLDCLVDPGAARDRTFPLEEFLQLEFTCAWIRYLSRSMPVDAKNSLQKWADLYHCHVMDSRLANLLVSEDDLEEEEALAVVYQAQNEVAASILRQVATDARLQFEKGDLASGIGLLKAILDSPIDDELEERALEPLAELATRLQNEVDLLIQEFAAWKTGDSTMLPREVLRLERLAETMEGRHPSARDWATTAFKWSEALINKMLGHAQSLFAAEDTAGAEIVLHEALTLCRTDGQRSWVKDHIAAFEQAITDEVEQLRHLAVRLFQAGDPVTARKATLDALDKARSVEQKAKLRQDLDNLELLIKTKGTRKTAKSPGNRQAASTQQGFAKPKAKPEAILGWGLLILVVMGLATTYWPEPPSSRLPKDGTGSETSANESSLTPPSEVEVPPTSSNGIEEFEQMEQEADRLEPAPRVALELEMNRLAGELERLQRDVKRSSERLEADRLAIESLKSEIDSTEPDPYSQVEIDAYNALVSEYERLRAKFNGKVEEHNVQVQREKELVRRHNDVVAKLNSGR